MSQAYRQLKRSKLSLRPEVDLKPTCRIQAYARPHPSHGAQFLKRLHRQPPRVLIVPGTADARHKLLDPSVPTSLPAHTVTQIPLRRQDGPQAHDLKAQNTERVSGSLRRHS